MEFEKLKKIIADTLNTDGEAITADTHLVNDLGADSLDLLQIAMEVEREFDIEIPEDQMEALYRVGDAVDYIRHIAG